MRDYTCDGVPVEQLSTEFIQECLADGIEILDSDGYIDAIDRVIKRLELELFIRANNLRARL